MASISSVSQPNTTFHYSNRVPAKKGTEQFTLCTNTVVDNPKEVSSQNKQGELSHSNSGYPFFALCDVSVLNELTATTPDYHEMTKANAIQTIMGRYDALMDKYAATETGRALDYARDKEFMSAGISEEERLSALKDSYLVKYGYEGLSDEQLKSTILEKYGNARDLTEGELYELHRELYEAGLSKWPPSLLSMMLPTSTSELKTRVQMSQSGVPITDSSWMNFVTSNRENMYTQKTDWIAYWENRISEHLRNGASEEVIRSTQDMFDLLLPGR